MSCLVCGQTNIGQTGEYPCAACGLPTLHDPDGADELPSYEEACASLRADGIDPNELGRRLRLRLEAAMGKETPADRARRLLEGATPGPWRYDRYDVVPTRSVSEGWLIADCGTSDSPDAADANVRLISAAPDLARDLIAESEAHEVTRAALAAVERERDEARAELAAAWEETGRPPGVNTLAGAVRWALRGRYSRDEMSEILGRREGETTAGAARRVVAERDALQGRW